MGAEIQGTVGSRPRRALHQRYLPWPKTTRLPGPGSGLFPGEPETCRRSLWPFLRNFTYLALLLAVFKVYRIEERAFQGRAFQMLVTLALAALPLHYLAPLRFKKPLFLAVSVTGLFWIFGIHVAAVVLGFSTILIGTCFLPVPWVARAAAVAAVAVTLACARASLPRAIIPDNVLPIVASMFMFRLMIYLYELKHVKTRETLIDTLCYFFLLPNLCFMHFPVVDYRTMQRGYFAADVHDLQRRGLNMMLRGTIHLLLYRLVYHEMLIPTSRVHDPASLACYLVCNYLLYLQVSGQFHIACGMLHLYGFQLPETHHNYLLATGFTDYWRRINIYWKDFMVRLFFNPVVFRLKRWPQPAALAVGTISVFLATWFLHAYQSFWLRGSWGFSAPDALFWGALGVMVLVNVQLDARRKPSGPRGTCRGAKGPTFHELFVRSVKVAATFSTIAVLWSLWSSPSLAAWLEMIGRGFHGS